MYSCICPCCKLLKRLVLDTHFQNGWARFSRNQYPEYKCDYDVKKWFFRECEVEQVPSPLVVV